MGQVIHLPSRAECEQLWEQYNTPLHIRSHMRQVQRVAVYLAEQLLAHGEYVIIELVDRAALLHDTVRVTDWPQLSFEYFPYSPTPADITVWEAQRRQWPPTVRHSAVNQQIFAARYPAVAQIISLHSFSDAATVCTWEEKLVHYADRRVAHDHIVTLQERLDESAARYSKLLQRQPLEHDRDIVAALYRIEDSIFSIIGGDPTHLPL